MSKRLLALNALLLVLAVAFAVQIARELTRPRPLPVAPEPRAVSQPPVAQVAKRRPEPPAAYTVIATKNLFSPSRSESAATSPTVAGQRPYLHGVVLDDARSRAYIEDPLTKRVHGYAVGDAVAGGRLDKIASDRVVILRPEGSLELLLRDPAKPRPTPPTPPQAQAASGIGQGPPQPPGAIVPRPGVAPGPLPTPGEGPVVEPARPMPVPPVVPSPGVPPQFLRRGMPQRPEAQQ